jgi:hypothetical protein
MDLRVWGWSIAALTLLSACAGSPAAKAPADRAPEGAPAQPTAGSARDVDAASRLPSSKAEALALVSQTEQQLAQLFPEEGRSEEKPGDERAKEPAPPPMPAGLPGAAPPGTTPLAEERVSRCAIACKALGSMRRAAGRLCELTGDGDESCSDARARLTRSEARVRRSCPACSE